ncbi:hypothetical protein A2U01_0095000, partial [Trifolium medium]|nr:hypothetical protein [Trifolium medium]
MRHCSSRDTVHTLLFIDITVHVCTVHARTVHIITVYRNCCSRALFTIC